MNRELRRLAFHASAVLVLLGGCFDADDEDPAPFFSAAEWAVIDTLSPLPAVPADPTNAFADDADAADLGKLYFFDARFSGPLVHADNETPPAGNGSIGQMQRISCSRCHDPFTGFSDRRSVPGNTSLAAGFTGRNAPTLYNVSYNTWYFWDGRKDSQWSQALGPTESGVEHNGNRVQFAMVIRDHFIAGGNDHDEVFTDFDADSGGPDANIRPFLASLDTTFGPPAFPSPDQPPDFAGQGRPGDSGQPGAGGNATYDSLTAEQKEWIDRIFANFGKAIAAYSRRIVSRDSAFDAFVAGDDSAISNSAKRGLKLFLGKGECITCHSGPNFTDNAFHNIGVDQLSQANIPTTDLGRFNGVPTVLADPFRGSLAFSDDTVAGAAKLAGLVQQPVQQGQFKTPTLRSISETGPFLHTGRLATLQDVVVFYNVGGDGAGFSGTKEISPLALTPEEIDDLVEFMKTLDGEELPASVTSTPTLP